MNKAPPPPPGRAQPLLRGPGPGPPDRRGCRPKGPPRACRDRPARHIKEQHTAPRHGALVDDVPGQHWPGGIFKNLFINK